MEKYHVKRIEPEQRIVMKQFQVAISQTLLSTGHIMLCVVPFRLRLAVTLFGVTLANVYILAVTVKGKREKPSRGRTESEDVKLLVTLQARAQNKLISLKNVMRCKTETVSGCLLC